MMDIYFALDDNSSEVKRMFRGIRKPPPAAESFQIETEKPTFERHLEDVKQLITNTMPKDIKTTRGITRSDVAIQDLVETVFKEVKDEITKNMRTNRAVDYSTTEMSPGYRRHLEDLEKLKRTHPDSIYPFLAIDPRRSGIIDLIEMKVNRGKGPFSGIKLYPPLGYLPSHPNLAPIYDYCIQYDIPIIAHTSSGGLKNFRRRNYVNTTQGSCGWEDFNSCGHNKSIFYANPDNWRPVLNNAKWSNLRLNLAHFGGGEELANGETTWMDSIIRLMGDYPNIYADMSYYVSAGLKNKMEEIIRKNPQVGTRVMFGTDFIMIMLDKNLGGLCEYFDRFAGMADSIYFDNAARFLKIQS